MTHYVDAYDNDDSCYFFWRENDDNLDLDEKI